MKPLLAFVTALLVGCSSARAQELPTGPLSRGDLHFVLGWQNLHKGGVETGNDWVNGILFGGVGAGWYWTDHLKTQVDFGGGTHGHQFRYTPDFSTNAQTAQFSELSVRQDSLAIAQHYQFFRNQWFHPHVGAGVDLARETITEVYQPIIGFDPATRTTRQIAAARTEGPDHHFIARPFVETGFKAYMTRRAFFTSDMRLMVRHGIDEVLFRVGFGIDF